MAQGLSLPVTVKGNGGASLIKGSKHLQQILEEALSEGGDDNPFQNLGIKPSIIFSINNQTTAGEMMLDIRRILKKFENRVGINPSKPLRIVRGQEGELGVSFGWVDLETNVTREFTAFFTRPGGNSGE
jgi:hypothetical protein